MQLSRLRELESLNFCMWMKVLKFYTYNFIYALKHYSFDNFCNLKCIVFDEIIHAHIFAFLTFYEYL